jgi:hypothetical protein
MHKNKLQITCKSLFNVLILRQIINTRTYAYPPKAISRQT